MDKIKHYSFQKKVFFSSSSLVILIMWLMFFAMNAETDWDFFLIPLVLFLPATFATAHHGLYYLVFTSHDIVVKNLLFFWVKISYDKNTIKEVTRVKKITGRGGWHGIEIVTKDPLKGDRYYTDLKMKDWYQLEIMFLKLGILYTDRT